MLSDVRTVLSEFSTVVVVFALTLLKHVRIDFVKANSLQTKRRNTFDSITSSTPLLVVCFDQNSNVVLPNERKENKSTSLAEGKLLNY